MRPLAVRGLTFTGDRARARGFYLRLWTVSGLCVDNFRALQRRFVHSRSGLLRIERLDHDEASVATTAAHDAHDAELFERLFLSTHVRDVERETLRDLELR
jgi:hypothetical protein